MRRHLTKRAHAQPIKLGVLLVAATMILGGLFVANPEPAEAQSAITCPEGVQSGVVCTIPDGPPVDGEYCPWAPVLLLDSQACTIVVPKRPATDVCTSPYVLSINNRCIVVNSSLDASFSCPTATDGSPVIDERVEADGAQVISVCIQKPPPKDYARCFGRRTQSEFPLYCRLSTDRVPGPTCPDGSSGFNDCFRTELAPGVILSCAAGVLNLDRCVVLGRPLRTDRSTCPTLYVEGECFLAEPADQDGNCALGYSPGPDPTECRRPVAMVPVSASCETGFQIINSVCARFEDPIGLPAIDCLGSDAGTPLCFGTAHVVAAPGAELLADTPTEFVYFGCAGGSAYFLASRPGGASPRVVLTEGNPGEYRGTWPAPSAGSYKLTFFVACEPGGRAQVGPILYLTFVAATPEPEPTPGPVGPAADQLFAPQLPLPAAFTNPPEVAAGVLGFGSAPDISMPQAASAVAAVAAAPAPVVASDSEPILAVTGSDTSAPAAVGIGLAGFGALLLIVRRRRF